MSVWAPASQGTPNCPQLRAFHCRKYSRTAPWLTKNVAKLQRGNWEQQSPFLREYCPCFSRQSRFPQDNHGKSAPCRAGVWAVWAPLLSSAGPHKGRAGDGVGHPFGRAEFFLKCHGRRQRGRARLGPGKLENGLEVSRGGGQGKM